MPRKPPHYAEQAARALLRGTRHTDLQSAVRGDARTDDEWCILLRRMEREFWSNHNRKARRAVKARHPVKVSAEQGI